MYLNEMIVIDLPSLQSITLGNSTLCGRLESCSLIMRSTNNIIRNISNIDLPNLTSINSENGGFVLPRSITLESIPIF